MKNILIQVATTNGATSETDLLASIGIDWKLLILQSIAFLLFLWVLNKFVYPPLSAILDKHQANLDKATKAAKLAEQSTADMEKRVAKMLKKAKNEASEIVAVARQESSDILDDAHKKAEQKTTDMLKTAQLEIDNEVTQAKKALQQETLELVALATGKILQEKIDSKKDHQLIANAIKEVR